MRKKSNTNFLYVVDAIKLSTNIIKINSEADIFKHKLKFIIKTPIYVFNDCNIKKMHNTYTPSKLLEIIISSKDGKKFLTKYFSYIDLFENDCLPIYKILTIRNLLIIIRIWRELVDAIYYFFKIKIKNKRFISFIVKFYKL